MTHIVYRKNLIASPHEECETCETECDERGILRRIWGAFFERLLGHFLKTPMAPSANLARLPIWPFPILDMPYARRLPIEINQGANDNGQKYQDKSTTEISHIFSFGKNSSKSLILSIIIGCALFLVPRVHASTYQYYRSITVTSTGSIASGTNSSFPMLVSSTEASWASSGHSGKIQNLVNTWNGIQIPADLTFVTTPANCGTSTLNFETLQYNSSTGALVDYVNVPTVATGTVIYVCYDNSSVTTDQSNASGTWNGNYLRVWHLGVNGNDSTSNGDTPASQSGTTYNQAGKFGQSVSFNQAGWLKETNNVRQTGDFTIEEWYNSNDDTFYRESLSYFNQWDGFVAGGGSTSSPGTFFEFHFNGNQINVNNPSINVWHQLITTVASATTIAYLDGTANGTAAAGSNASNINANEPFLIGSNAAASGNYNYSGNLQEVRVLGAVLSPQWTITEYNNENSPDDSQGGNGFYHVGAETSTGGGGGGNIIKMIFQWIEDL